MPTAYEILGVARDADHSAIRSAYRAHARAHHPDRAGGDAERFLAIRAAYEILVDPEKRAAHDANPEGIVGETVELMRRKAQLRRRRDRLRKLYE